MPSYTLPILFLYSCTPYSAGAKQHNVSCVRGSLFGVALGKSCLSGASTRPSLKISDCHNSQPVHRIGLIKPLFRTNLVRLLASAHANEA